MLPSHFSGSDLPILLMSSADSCRMLGAEFCTWASG